MSEDPEDHGSAPPDPPEPDAVAELRAWFDRHCRNSGISRDTRVYNTIHSAVAAIEQAIATVRQEI